jgi:type I restriction-modification system DNA methylase subunit
MNKKEEDHINHNAVKKFIKTLENIDHGKNINEIFIDFLIITSAALYSWKKDKKVEEEYLQIVKRYSKEQVSKMAELVGIMAINLQKEKTDFLGDVYSISGLANKKLGQFFTPYHIARFMTESAIIESDIKSKRIYKIYDSTCGSGVMLIAALAVVEKHGIDFKKKTLLVGKDISNQCAYMTFIQLSLLEAAAIVICGNTLTNEVIWQRETLWYHVYNIDKQSMKSEKKEKNMKAPKIGSGWLKKDLPKELF